MSPFPHVVGYVGGKLHSAFGSSGQAIASASVVKTLLKRSRFRAKVMPRGEVVVCFCLPQEFIKCLLPSEWD